MTMVTTNSGSTVSELGNLSFGYNKGVLALLVVLGIGFVAGGCFIIYMRPGPSTVLIGAASILLFGGHAISLLPEFARRDAVITLTPQFFHDRRLGPTPIPWREIDNVKFTQMWLQAIVELNVASPQRFIRPTASVTAFVSRWNPSFGYEQLTLPLLPLKEKSAVIADEIQRYWRAARADQAAS